MTKKEAITELRKCKQLILQDGKDWFDEKDLEVLDIAIEALSANTPTETPTVFIDEVGHFPKLPTNQCAKNAQSDLISRQDAIKEMDRYWKASRTDNCGIEHTATVGEHAAVDICKIAIQSVPSVKKTCDGCKHQGQWEQEYEQGYNCPCLRCSRRAVDSNE